MKTCRRKLHTYADDLKTCPDCNRLNARVWNIANKDRYKATNKAWKKANPEKLKDSVLRDKFGISLEQYNDMLVQQDHKCAICKHPETISDPRSNKVRSLAVDHCHETGKVRNLLCHACNQTLGLIKEDLTIATEIVSYLTIWKLSSISDTTN